MVIGAFLFLLFLLTLIVYFEVRKFFINRQLKNVVLVNGAPLIGVIGRILMSNNNDVLGFILKFFDEAKSSAIRFWVGPVMMLGIYDPANVKTILTHKSALDRPLFYEYFHCKTSTLSADNQLWKPNRRALNSAFTMSLLSNHLPQINENALNIVKRMQSHLNEPGNVFRTISVCMINLNFRTMLGVDLKDGERFFEISKQVMNSILNRFPRIWFRYDCIYHNLSKAGREERRLVKYESDIIEQLCNQKLAAMRLRPNAEHSVQNLLDKCLQLEREGVLSRQNILDEMRLILIAGQETVATAIFGALLLLAINQRHQEFVVQELRSIFENCNADCEVTQPHLAAMKYTECVIKESMRLLPPIAFIGRKTTADISLTYGTVPKGTNVMISIIHMNRNPQVWGENVLEFHPDRFLSENTQKRSPLSYIPFSAGSRNCIGMKLAMMIMKTVLAHLLRQYKFTTDLKFDDIKLAMHIVTNISIDKPLKIEKRNF